jgi:hypothetical protein
MIFLSFLIAWSTFVNTASPLNTMARIVAGGGDCGFPETYDRSMTIAGENHAGIPP